MSGLQLKTCLRITEGSDIGCLYGEDLTLMGKVPGVEVELPDLETEEVISVI